MTRINSELRRMQLSINGKQLDLGAAFREYIEGQMPLVVDKYFENPTEGHETMYKQGHEVRADVTVHVGKGFCCKAMLKRVTPMPHSIKRSSTSVNACVAISGVNAITLKNVRTPRMNCRHCNMYLKPRTTRLKTQTSPANPSSLRSWRQKSKN